MKLRKIYIDSRAFNSARLKNRRGFTLIEAVVAVGIISIIGGLGLIMSMESYGNYLLDSERTLIVGLLEKARNKAMNNVGQVSHGVHFEPSSYVVFRGNSYVAGALTNEVIGANPGTIVTKGVDTVFDQVFYQLTGNPKPTVVADITITNGARTREISINNEGRIDW